jgi:hypothetical protein
MLNAHQIPPNSGANARLEVSHSPNDARVQEIIQTTTNKFEFRRLINRSKSCKLNRRKWSDLFPRRFPDQLSIGYVQEVGSGPLLRKTFPSVSKTSISVFASPLHLARESLSRRNRRGFLATEAQTASRRTRRRAAERARQCASRMRLSRLSTPQSLAPTQSPLF